MDYRILRDYRIIWQVDLPADVKDGSVPGVKNAAIRKLDHELGISAGDVPFDSFKFLTRLHYYAADAVTHGPNAPWGEHEIDYILFIQVLVFYTADHVLGQPSCVTGVAKCMYAQQQSWRQDGSALAWWT